MLNDVFNETKKLDNKKYGVMVNSIKAVVTLVKGWVDNMKLCNQKVSFLYLDL